MAERGVGGWRGLPEGGGGGSRRKRRQCGFKQCVDSSVAARKGVGKATVRLLLRGQLDMGRDVQERLKTDLASWQTPRP